MSVEPLDLISSNPWKGKHVYNRHYTLITIIVYLHFVMAVIAESQSYNVFLAVSPISIVLLPGGAELGAMLECIVCEEFGFGCSGIATAAAANNLAVSWLWFTHQLAHYEDAEPILSLHDICGDQSRIRDVLMRLVLEMY